MSRIRTIKPEFWGHTKVSRISRDARLLFLGLLNEADDEGLLLGSTRRIAGVVFPHDDDVTPKKIERWVDELESVCLVHRYTVEGTAYLFLCGFTEHQKISHPTPSRLPNPSGADLELSSPDLGKERSARSATRATRIPEDFVVTEEMIEWVERECPGLDWKRHTQRFVNHWKSTAKNATKLDWRKTWDNWMLKEAG